LQLHRLAGGSATGLSATGAWAILVSLDGAAADDASSVRLILKTSETFVCYWQNRPLTESKRVTRIGKWPAPTLPMNGTGAGGATFAAGGLKKSVSQLEVQYTDFA
jgi:hypothetical protein